MPLCPLKVLGYNSEVLVFPLVSKIIVNTNKYGKPFVSSKVLQYYSNGKLISPTKQVKKVFYRIENQCSGVLFCLLEKDDEESLHKV